MAEVSITLNRRTYRFQCGEGEVEHLNRLADFLKGKLDILQQEHGPIGDERLLLMAALTLADELFEARADIDDLLDDETDKLKKVAKNATHSDQNTEFERKTGTSGVS